MLTFDQNDSSPDYFLLPLDEHREVSAASTNASDNSSSYDRDTYLADFLGPRHRSNAESIVLIFVYSAIFVTGVVGNLCTCAVIIRNKRMQTVTNYYLFSLAVSDILTLVLGLPPELYTIVEAYPWRFGEPYCLFKTFLTEMTSSASILTIASFTVERYLAICHSFRAQAMSGLSRAVRNILIIWGVACLTALVYPIHTRTYYYLTNPDTHEPIPESLVCNIPVDWMQRMTYAFQLSSFLLFVLPMVLISALYIQIGVTLNRSDLTRHCSQSGGSANNGAPTRARSRKAVFKMLVAVVVAFFVCWAPFHVQRLTTIYIRNDISPVWMEIQSALFYISGILYFVSCTVNPILYNLMSRNYRQAFCMTLCCRPFPGDPRLHYAGTFYHSERTATGCHGGVGETFLRSSIDQHGTRTLSSSSSAHPRYFSFARSTTANGARGDTKMTTVTNGRSGSKTRLPD